MVGILVHGNNHFILSGPEPNRAAALALVRHWSIIQIGVRPGAPGGEGTSRRYEQWEIRTKEFRENLKWAVVVPGEGEISSGVAQLLADGVSIVDPEEGWLSCRDQGVGRMAAPEKIRTAIERALKKIPSPSGRGPG